MSKKKFTLYHRGTSKLCYTSNRMSKKKVTLYPDNPVHPNCRCHVVFKKKSTLYPDNRKDFYSKFEDFLLVNRQLVILIIIIALFSLFIIGCLLAIPYFQAENVYNAFGGI